MTAHSAALPTAGLPRHGQPHAPHRLGVTLMQESRLIHRIQIVVRELEHKPTLHAPLARYAPAPAAREVARLVAAAYTDAIESFQRAERDEEAVTGEVFVERS